MPEFTTILRSMDTDKFLEVFAASSRQARETYFRRHGVRKPKKKLGLNRASDTSAERVKGIWAILQDTTDDEMSEEILRTWLLGKREMLACALDHLEIEHNHGLTDSDDISKIEKLHNKELKKLVEAMKDFPNTDVRLYLEFMGAKDVASLF